MSDSEQSFLSRIKKNLEVVATVLLGLGTILAAFAAYQSALWGGNCLTAYNQAVIKFGDANREYLNGALATSFDTMVYLEYLKEDPRTAEDVDKMISKDMVRAIAWADQSYDKKIEALEYGEEAKIESALEAKWEEFDEHPEDSPEREKALAEIYELEAKIAYIPFLESPRYQISRRSPGDNLAKEAQAKMEEGIKANQTGDAFTLITVYFTIALFFAGLAAVLRDERSRLILLGLSSVVFLFSLVRMLLLPFA
ncbi:MAG: hypothetical protein CMN76_10760 [Spirochaetaceae bacterium]|nr:hypothetical protein [Spirochaetaceae bacterium]|tara:strand:+ start:24432 stop:25193 length:762 start_codon:yes stop_codon:yes gene_type:complete